MPQSLVQHLTEHAQAPAALCDVVMSIAESGKDIQRAIQTTATGKAGSVNQFGEEQKQLDVVSNDIIRQRLSEASSVHSYLTEEQADITVLHEDGSYAVVFDPLDGSSLIDANFAIGSIFGVYQTREILGRRPKEQVAALYVLYGPRTLLVYSAGQGVHVFALGDSGEFALTAPDVQIGPEATHYSPGNLRALTDNPGYQKAMDRWLQEAMTLRYSGCMVADIHHILVKGQGVFTNVGGAKYPDGKLRHPFECGPFAYLVEQAGGVSSDGQQSILDKEITDVDQRTPIIVGSKNEVETVVKLLGE